MAKENGQEAMDSELYGGGGDKYAGYATTIPMDEEEEEEEPRPGIGGPRCVCARSLLLHPVFASRAQHLCSV